MEKKEKQIEYEKVPTKVLLSDEEQKVPASYGYGIRHVQSLLLFFCITIGYMGRAHLGVTVVAMSTQKNARSTVNSTNIYYNSTKFGLINESDRIINDTFANNLNVSNEVDFGDKDRLLEFVNENEVGGIWNVYRTYDWPKPIQEMILDSFFVGYSLLMFPMGMVCQRFGGKIPLQICLMVNGVVSIITPTVAAWGGWKAVCCCRILQGMSQAGLYPSTHTMLGKWVPISERATFSSYVYTGTTLGTVISFQLSGLLAYSSAGWPCIFWLVGSGCLVTFILFTVFAASTPADHKAITVEEKNFILGRIDDGSTQQPKIPWKHVLRSKPVWAIIVTHIFSGVCFVFLFTQIPTYMIKILGFNIKESGLLSSLPYIASFFSSMVYGMIADYCINKGYVTLRNSRIICNTLGQAGPAICLIAVSFTDNSTLAVMLLVLAVGLYAGVHAGWMVNYIDLSPNFSGSLMAFGNTGAGLGVLSQPVLVSNIVTDVTNRSQWRIMMFLMAGFIFFSNVIYVCFMSTDTQPWNEINEAVEGEEEKLQDKTT